MRWPTAIENWDMPTSSMPVDVDENEEEVIVTASLPGMDPERVDISVTREGLTIKGKSERKEEKKTKNSYCQEIEYGEFSRFISWPTEVKTDQVEAHFDNGLLKVVAPKAEEVKPKSVKVKVSAQK